MWVQCASCIHYTSINRAKYQATKFISNILLKQLTLFPYIEFFLGFLLTNFVRDSRVNFPEFFGVFEFFFPIASAASLAFAASSIILNIGRGLIRRAARSIFIVKSISRVRLIKFVTLQSPFVRSRPVLPHLANKKPKKKHCINVDIQFILIINNFISKWVFKNSMKEWERKEIVD